MIGGWVLDLVHQRYAFEVWRVDGVFGLFWARVFLQ